jgi:hypothetical protein
MKVINILIALGTLFLPCLYYNSSGLVSVGYEMAQVMEKSYISLIADISEIAGPETNQRSDS